MPRITPSQAQPTFIARPVPLSEKAKEELLRIVGYGHIDLLEESLAHQMPDAAVVSTRPGEPVVLVRGVIVEGAREKSKAGQMILEVEAALGLGVNGAEHLDKIPRASDYKTVYEGLARDSLALLNKLTGLSQYYRDQFAACEVDVYEIDRTLATLADTSVRLEAKFANISSKGAPKKLALLETISRLRRIFRDYYAGPMSEATSRGAARLKSPQQHAEFNFVWCAVRDARLMADNPRNLLLLEEWLRDPKTAQREDRNETISRIAKANYARQAVQEKKDARKKGGTPNEKSKTKKPGR
ncbi:MAG: hypothetical protein IPK20_06635 [Betaproteobacteria bacterium]|nr:hypothetical protein [Betaproteobacteria bacterium]